MNSSIKEIVEKYMHTVWNEKNVNFIDQAIDDDVRVHSLLGESNGKENLKAVTSAWLTGFPDMQVTNDIVINEGDMVSTQWHVKATHMGEFKGIQATGRPVTYKGVTVYRFSNNKIIEYWAYIDMQDLMRQIG
jgi:steroid delta-isomerase-like uncharacterized protein